MDPSAAVVTAKETSRGARLPFWQYGVSAMQGCRPSMEDAHIVEGQLLPHHALFCVLDGHGGNQAAVFASQELTQLLEDNEDFQNYYAQLVTTTKKKKHNNNNKQDDKVQRDLLEQALKRTFVALDRSFYEACLLLEGDAHSKTYPGSTAVLVLVTPTHIVCSNLGDSRCVLARSSTSAPSSVTAHPLSRDHKPDLPDEERRILAAGGTVEMGRVDGELAVSRALGDFEHKEMELLLDYYNMNDPDDLEPLLKHAQRQKVSPVPEIRWFDRQDTTDRFLVLACDGVWDVVENQECVEWIAELLRTTNGDVGMVCERILDMCLQQGSQDNMTIVIVLLGEAGLKMIGSA